MSLPQKYTTAIWKTFIVCRVATYIGYSEKKVDQDGVFTSAEFETLVQSAGIDVKLSGVHFYNARGAGERYHGHLRRIFLKIIEDIPGVDWNIALNSPLKR